MKNQFIFIGYAIYIALRKFKITIKLKIRKYHYRIQNTQISL